jgi:hypothetical protein
VTLFSSQQHAGQMWTKKQKIQPSEIEEVDRVALTWYLPGT